MKYMSILEFNMMCITKSVKLQWLARACYLELKFNQASLRVECKLRE